MRFKKFPKTKSIFVDIDGTLISRGKLNHIIIEYCRHKKAEGFDIVLWSARGREYAEDIAAKFDLAGFFTAIIGKPGYIIDDIGWSWIKNTKHLTLDDIE